MSQIRGIAHALLVLPALLAAMGAHAASIRSYAELPIEMTSAEFDAAVAENRWRLLTDISSYGFRLVVVSLGYDQPLTWLTFEEGRSRLINFEFYYRPHSTEMTARECDERFTSIRMAFQSRYGDPETSERTDGRDAVTELTWRSSNALVRATKQVDHDDVCGVLFASMFAGDEPAYEAFERRLKAVAERSR